MPRKILILLALLLLFGAGCSGSSVQPSETDSTSQEEAPTDTISDSQDSDASSGRMSGRLALGSGPRHILLLGSDCEVQNYAVGPTQIIRQKEVGSYTVVITRFEEGEAPEVSESDACLKMSFSTRDVRSLKEMLALLQAELQQDLEEKEVSVSLQNDLPGSCEEVAKQIAKRFPQAYEKALARCEELQKQQQQEQQEGADDELVYDSTNAQCTTAPDTNCSPSMSATEYVKYSMNYVTPTNSTVTKEASLYEDISSMYVAMQKRPWQSDTSIFGCSDKFQEPSYYLSVSPKLESSMMCATPVGDCDDKANAFGSLLIASGLFGADEVRTALGTVQFGSKPSDIGGHAWTEVYLKEEKHWIPVDAVMGNTCYETGKCAIYDEDDFIDWDYFNYVEYPVLEYWGWSNDKMFYIPSTKQGSTGLPDFWKEETKTVYEALK